ncbi:MAG: ABC transporter permease [Proteobacteria bacterium]|nr:ABC transporter permease [Pseudomonadota bacterium]
MESVTTFGRSGLFFITAIYYVFRPPYRFSRILSEIEFIGAKSFLIVFVTAIFTGMVLGLQGYYTLNKFGADAMLGAGVALSIVRELGPVLCALMVAGRAGSAITAEIGIMKITDQVPALEMMAIDPVQFIISPKIVAALISLPILTAFFDLVGILGGYIVGVNLLGINEGSFFGQMVSLTTWPDIYGGLIKSVCFGGLISWICCFVGFNATATTEGVSKATTNAVVISSITILMSDYILTSVLL